MVFSVVYIGMLLAMAVGAAVAAWLLVAIVGGLAKARGEGFLHFLFYPMLLSLALATLFSARTFDTLDPTLLLDARHPIAAWASRFASVFFLVTALERVFSRFISKDPTSSSERTWLVAAFVSYWITNVALPSIFGASPAFSHQFLYCLIIGVGILMLGASEAEKAINVARNALLMFILLSFVAAIVRPDLVLDRSYLTGLLPGFKFRFAGLAPHANSMGGMAALSLLLLWSHPYQWRALNLAGWFLGAAALITCQSKTSWAAFVLGATCMLIVRAGPSLKRAVADRSRAPQLVVVLSVLMVALLLAATLLMFGGGFDKVERVMNSRVGDDLMTLTGRVEIWGVALDEWRRNPLFGYGPTVWDLRYRIGVGILYAYHAHNQFFNVLAMAGTVGAVGFIFYFFALGTMAIRFAVASGGLSLAIFALIVFRSIAEVPLAILVYGPEQIVQFLLLIVIAAHLRSKAPAHAPILQKLPNRVRAQA